MTYAICEDCGSVGRFHYTHCKNGDQPRVEIADVFDDKPRNLLAEEQPTVSELTQIVIDAAVAATTAKHAPKMTKTKLLDDAKATVADRGVAYGGVEDNFARIANLWNAHLENRGVIVRGTNVNALTPGDVAMMMVLMKTARLENQPNHPDSWTDIAGYAACGAEITA